MALTRKTDTKTGNSKTKPPVKTAPAKPAAAVSKVPTLPEIAPLKADMPVLDALLVTPDEAADVFKTQMLDVREMSRKFSEGFLQQAGSSYEKLKGASEQATASAQQAFEAARDGAGELQRKQIEIVKSQVDASFELAQSLVGISSIAEATGLVNEFWRKQFESGVAAQQDLTALAKKVGEKCISPMQSSIKSGVAAFDARG